MYNFIIQSYSTYKGLFYWLNWPGYISGVLLQPFATVIMFAVLGRFTSNPDIVRAYALGIAVMGMAFILIGGITQSYSRERGLGATQFIFVSTANRLVNFLARMVLHYPNAALSFICGLLAAWIILELDFGTVAWNGFLIAALVLIFSLTAFGQLLGVLSVAVRDWIGIQGIANGLLLILSGAIIPVTAFPGFIQEFARLLPVTNGLFALKAAFTGAAFSAISGDILREGITGLAYLAIAYTGFRVFEAWVKRTGTLERDAI
ncbi:MAG TPA: ABC transporter permease [Dehalococcoidales bacterium]|nr:ABC transporter permease [Dehalococcoidales bacterium]